MSRGFVSTLIGLAITLFAWFSPWSWPAWPALTLLTFAPRPENYAGRAIVVVVLIVINMAVWSGLVYGVMRGLKMRNRRLLLLALLLLGTSLNAAGVEKAVFAGGCFWCTESDFEKVPGVISALSGYTGRDRRESVEVTFDPQRVSYAHLLDVYWHSIDPTDNAGQFCDDGPQYRSAIFYLNEVQRQQAEASKAAVLRHLGKVYTEILPAGPFDAAGRHDQDYYRRNPVRYRFYRYNCGRDQRLKAIWGNAPGSH